MIATGERCAVETMAPEYAETEKRLIGSALSGFPIIALDNCRGVIEGDFFCQVVERPLMNLRALGKSDKHRIPNTYTFVLGKWLAKHEGHIAGGVKLMVDRADAARPKWYVNFVDKKDDDHNG